ncbi:MAG: polysaccharide biosynthesis protein [bacterium]|nr:polysaccharide biosynthesis protein [bacterium]
MSIIDKVTPKQRKFVLILSDSIFTVITLLLAFLIIQKDSISSHLLLFPLYVFIRVFTFNSYGVYMFLWRYASIREMVILAKAVTMSSFLVMSSLFILKAIDFPKSILLIEWALNLILIDSSRIFLRLFRDYVISKNATRVHKKDRINMLIIGAGDAGEIIAREIQKVSSLRYNLVGFIDDKETKTGQIIHQTPVLGTTKNIFEIVKQYNVKEAIIAIPSASGPVIRRIMTLCEQASIKFKTTPGLYSIIGGKVSVSQLREVRIEDLLGREVVDINLNSIAAYLSDSVILVTGAGGSIGAELCRQTYRFSPAKLLLLDNNENAVYHIHMEMERLKRKEGSNVEIVPIVGDIRNKARLEEIFALYKPELVFHAAAYKHVPLMEIHVKTVIENNIAGTKNILDLSDKYNVRELLLISTDKAVFPVNSMGISKRIGEVMMEIKAEDSKTKFTAVRFGNVLGSQGSVVPLFKKQIAEGGPITVTHPEVTRYFMTIPEAISLIIQAGALSKSGEIVILDMGKPVNILTLAKDLIHLSGLEEGKDIDIEYIGMRPGEKMNEDLFFDKKDLEKTKHKKIFISKPYNYEKDKVKSSIDQLISDFQMEKEEILKAKLRDIVQNTQPEQK